MKTWVLTFLMGICMALGLQGQNKNNYRGVPKKAYNKSLAAFEAGKKVHGDSYIFSVRQASFTGYVATTTMVVVDGRVVERRFKADNKYQPEVAAEWVETAADLGSHDEGVPAMTFGEVYMYAEKLLAPAPRLDNEKSEYYFNVDKNGLIELVGSRAVECMDDCFRGYRIAEFSWSN